MFGMVSRPAEMLAIQSWRSEEGWVSRAHLYEALRARPPCALLSCGRPFVPAAGRRVDHARLVGAPGT
jgi:hypothetical protein